MASQLLQVSSGQLIIREDIDEGGLFEESPEGLNLVLLVLRGLLLGLGRVDETGPLGPGHGALVSTRSSPGGVRVRWQVSRALTRGGWDHALEEGRKREGKIALFASLQQTIVACACLLA